MSINRLWDQSHKSALGTGKDSYCQSFYFLSIFYLTVNFFIFIPQSMVALHQEADLLACDKKCFLEKSTT